MIDVRLSEQARDQLIRLKRATGIKTWNVLCRWAFCVSLAEEEAIGDAFDSNESAIEMRWDIFGGEYQHAYQAILADECYRMNQEINDRSMARLVRQHIHRGINILLNKMRVTSLANMLGLTL